MRTYDSRVDLCIGTEVALNSRKESAFIMVPDQLPDFCHHFIHGLERYAAIDFPLEPMPKSFDWIVLRRAHGSWPGGPPTKDGANVLSGAGSVDRATTHLYGTSRTKKT